MATGSNSARRALAWSVHLYTALGLLLAALATALVVQGTEESFRAAFGLLLVATLVDATDGWLARRVRVVEVLPAFDGRRLDDIIDFHTYTSIPLLLIWRADLLPGRSVWILILPLLASAFGFSRRDAKTADGYFLGFPSYWNVVAFYLFFLRPPPWLSVVVLMGFSVLTLLPSRYLNLAAGGRRFMPLLAMAAAWALLLAAILVGAVEGRLWVLISLLFPAAYLMASWVAGRRSVRPGVRSRASR